MLKVAPILYHGTTYDNAEGLLRNGWRPNEVPVGSNNGRPEYLYLSTDQVDAAFYGYMNDEYEHTVLAVRDVPLAALAIDPEDSQTSTVGEELAHAAIFPGRVLLTQPIPANHFSRLGDSTNL
jgi:hypothetical protein